MSYNKKNFHYYEFEVGRYLPNFTDNKKTFKPYKEDKSKLVWNVIVCDFDGVVYPRNIFEYNWVFLKDGLLYAKKHYSNNFKKFADHVRSWLQYEYWARTEYEILVSRWPGKFLYQEDIDKLQKELDEESARNKRDGYDSITPSTQYCDPSTVKIDVYTQVMMNWDRFIHYVWDNKRLITKKKLGL